jgi:hypothetical protein
MTTHKKPEPVKPAPVTPAPVTLNASLPSCPFINVPNCPYTKDTAGGCPYLGQVKAKTINVPEYCPILK